MEGTTMNLTEGVRLDQFMQELNSVLSACSSFILKSPDGQLGNLSSLFGVLVFEATISTTL
jgi:hypothetical protein